MEKYQKIWNELYKGDNPYENECRGEFFYWIILKEYENKIKDKLILDIGCGDLFYLEDLIQNNEDNIFIIGIDFSEEALKLAKKIKDYKKSKVKESLQKIKNLENKIKKYPKSKKFYENQIRYYEKNIKELEHLRENVDIHLIKADARYLPLRENVSDITLSSETLFYLLNDIEKGIQEMKRVSKDEMIFSIHSKEFYEKGQYKLNGNIVSGMDKPDHVCFSKKEVKELLNVEDKNIRVFLARDLITVPLYEPWRNLSPPNAETVYLIKMKKNKKL